MWNGRRPIEDRRVRGVRGPVIPSLLLVSIAHLVLAAAGEQRGQVIFNGLPVPGATIVATQNDTKIAATSDAEGWYRLTGLSDGPYVLRVEMLGFAPLTRDLNAGDDAHAPQLELAMLPFDEIKRIAAIAPVA